MVIRSGYLLPLLGFPDEDYGWMQISALRGGEHVLLAECKLHCKACALDHD
jgi:hypothetical protein